MILGAGAIKAFMDIGAIIIDPFKEEQLQTASYDVRLGKYYYTLDQRFDPIDLAEVVQRHFTLHAADDNSRIILDPGAFILAHTEEFIGSTVSTIVPYLKTRSTAARWGIDICGSAGWGDPGYCSRWTLEIKNNTSRTLVLRKGVRIGQIVFASVADPEGRKYTSTYNTQRAQWGPDCMLPKNLR